jgi:hypothetical protein
VSFFYILEVYLFHGAVCNENKSLGPVNDVLISQDFQCSFNLPTQPSNRIPLDSSQQSYDVTKRPSSTTEEEEEEEEEEED